MRCVHFPISQNRKRKVSAFRYSNLRSNSTVHWIHTTRSHLLSTREAVPIGALGDLSEVTQTHECHRDRREGQMARRSHKCDIASQHRLVGH